MKNKIKTTVALLCLMISQAMAQEIQLSLLDAINEGLNNNPEVLNAKIGKQISRSKLTQSKSQLYPQIEAHSDYFYYHALPKLVIPGEMFGQEGEISAELGTKYDWSSGFRATQILFNQSYFTSLKIARQMQDIEQLNVMQKEEVLAFQISQVYYLCQASVKQVKHLSVMMSNMDHLLQLTKLQEQNEVIRKIDHDQILVDRNNLQIEVDNLYQMHDQQLNLLKYLTGINLNTRIVLTDSLSYASINDQIVNPVWDDRLEIRSINRQIDLTNLSKKMYKQEYLPSVSGFARYYYQSQSNKLDFFDGGENKFFKVGLFGLSLSIPIFDGHEKRAKIQQQDFTLQQLQNSKNHLFSYMEKEFLDAKMQFQNNKRAVLRQEENISIAEKNYRVTLLGYQQNTVSLTDLLRAQNSLTEAHLSYENALLQLKNAELSLLKAKGKFLYERDL